MKVHVESSIKQEKSSNGVFNGDLDEREDESFQHKLIGPQGPRGAFPLHQNGAYNTRGNSSA